MSHRTAHQPAARTIASATDAKKPRDWNRQKGSRMASLFTARKCNGWKLLDPRTTCVTAFSENCLANYTSPLPHHVETGGCGSKIQRTLSDRTGNSNPLSLGCLVEFSDRRYIATPYCNIRNTRQVIMSESNGDATVLNEANEPLVIWPRRPPSLVSLSIWEYVDGNQILPLQLLHGEDP
jgi:hypothetical protein